MKDAPTTLADTFGINQNSTRLRLHGSETRAAEGAYSAFQLLRRTPPGLYG